MPKSTRRVVRTRSGRPRAISYVRQSLYREESISLEVQDAANREHAKRHGYDAIETISDPGVSGLQFAKRPGIRRAIEMIEAGDAEVIVVWKWSRLSRRRVHQAVIIDRIEKVGGRVESATEPVDTSTAGGRFSREVLLAAAALESETKSEQWREAQTRRIRLGLNPGGPVPYGYRRSEVRDAPFTPDPETADVVRQMYADYIAGRGPQWIAKDINERGLMTSKGKPFSTLTVTRILDSGAAAGLLLVHDPQCTCRPDENGKRCGHRVNIPGAHEPLIDASTWATYQRERNRRRQIAPKARQPKWELGGGKSVCGYCGGNLVVNSYKADYAQAICSNYTTKRTCRGVWVSTWQLHTAVLDWVDDHIALLAEQADETLDLDEERAQLTTQLKDLHEQEEKIQNGRQVAAKLAARGDMTEMDYLAAKRDADEALAQVAERVREIEAEIDALGPASADVEMRIGNAAHALDDEGWSKLLVDTVRRIAVTKETVTIQGWRGEPTVLSRRQKPFLPRPRKDAQARDTSGRFIKST